MNKGENVHETKTTSTENQNKYIYRKMIFEGNSSRNINKKIKLTQN